MNGGSRHGSSRPDRARAKTAAAPRGNGRPDVDTARLERLLEPVVQAAGLDLESVRIGSAGRRRLLRVVVDGDGGVSLDSIALVSREVSVRLDDTGAMGEAPYTLEVSSPGVDRPLTQPRHWRRALGRLVRVPLTGPDPGAGAHVPEPAGQVEGRVVAADTDGIVLDVAGEPREFGYAELGPGRVQVEFGRPAAEPGREAAPAGAATEPRTGGRADGH